MDSFLESLCCSPTNRAAPLSYPGRQEIIVEKPAFTPYADDDEVQRVVEAFRTAKTTGKGLEDEINAIISATRWTDSIAEAILHSLEALLQKGAVIGEAMKDAVGRATSLAWEFAEEHPVYAGLIAAGTIIAIGVLVIMGPGWILEALGFATRGPRIGSFAARWMSRIAESEGHVFKGSFYSYLQRLGMTLNFLEVEIV